MSTPSAQLSPVISELDEIVDHLSHCRERAASAFAAEMFFFERVAGVVERRDRERGARNGSITKASQLSMREVFAEIAAELRLSEWQVARKVSLAWTLTHQFDETLCDASCGRISPEHATVIADTGAVIEDDKVRREYEAVALDMAAEMTPGQLRPALDGLVQRLDPEGTEQRVWEAVKRRKVTVRELEPGLSRVTADVPTAQGVGLFNRLRDMAAELYAQNEAERAEAEAAAIAKAEAEADARVMADARGATTEAGDAATAAGDTPVDGDSGDADAAHVASGADGSHAAGHADTTDAAAEAPVFDERTQAQIMADVFCDLLLTSNPTGHGATDQARSALGAIAPTVQVTVPATTLAGTTIGGAAVAGFGPIDDDTAKQLAGIAPGWVRVFTDPSTGVPISVDRYRPTKKQKLYLQVRDWQCRFPGCRRAAQKCDIDHTIAYAEGGPTCLCNLEHLCKRHHTLKHDTDWTVEQLGGGILRWTAPTRRTHITRPPGTVRFQMAALLDPDPKHRHALREALERDPAPF